MQVESLKELLHGDLATFEFVHNTVSVHAVRLLDKAKEVFLVHAGGSMDVGVHLQGQRSGLRGCILQCLVRSQGGARAQHVHVQHVVCEEPEQIKVYNLVTCLS